MKALLSILCVTMLNFLEAKEMSIDYTNQIETANTNIEFYSNHLRILPTELILVYLNDNRESVTIHFISNGIVNKEQVDFSQLHTINKLITVKTKAIAYLGKILSNEKSSLLNSFTE